ncbi:MAG: lipopolysaccharide transport periplasmic protein LptA [Nitrospirae bacterium]|nr:lipopolysaccharide transport periplasmic protein LptA [Nitrospirota bacterium]
MLRQFFIVNFILSALLGTVSAATLIDKQEKKPIIITSETLTADNKNSTAIFEGAVVAKTDNVTIYADKMTVFYDNARNKVTKIQALGHVKVHKDETALFSDEATYLEEDQKIIFTGNPKAVNGENVISGMQIIFYIKDDRAEVQRSRVVLQNKQELN